MKNLPPPLKPGDTIGIPAPASPFNRERFDQGVEVLKSLGYRVLVPEETHQREGYLAGSDRERAAALNRMFADPGVQAIVCARGGYGSMRMLPHLDFASIRENPKMVMGFSDLSALFWALFDRCGLVTIHGPTVTTLAIADDATLERVAAMLSGERKAVLRPASGITLRSGIAKGRLLGGNLTTLCHLSGTPFSPVFRDRILLLEDRGEAPYRIDRMLSQMRLAGGLDDLAGIILGSFEKCGEPADLHRIVMEIIDDPEVPILAGFGIGHGKTNIPIPMGMKAVLDADEQVLRFNL